MIDILLFVVKKEVIFEIHALEEFEALNKEVREEFHKLIQALINYGQLREPNAKKLTTNLFELRVRVKGQWRDMYAYYQEDKIIILRFLHKKTQKTPKQEIELALNRFKKAN